MISPDIKKNTMKAAQGKELGDIDAMLTVEDNVAIPDLNDLTPKQRRNKMIIQTKAVALACGDCRVLSGKTRKFQGPPSFPYIPGGDCSGIVWQIPPEASEDPDYPFKVGDRVAARFSEGPRGALAEYAVIDITVCLEFERTHLTRTMTMAQDGTLKASMDSQGPFPFTTEGVRKAFRLQETRHIKGKVVITLND